MDRTGYQQKHQPSRRQHLVWFCLIFIQVSGGELAGPSITLSRSSILLASNGVHVMGFSLCEIPSQTNRSYLKAEVVFTQQPIKAGLQLTDIMLPGAQKMGMERLKGIVLLNFSPIQKKSGFNHLYALLTYGVNVSFWTLSTMLHPTGVLPVAWEI